MAHVKNISKTAGPVTSVQMTQAEAVGAIGQVLVNTRIYIVDGAGVPTGAIYESGAAGQVPAIGGGGGGGGSKTATVHVQASTLAITEALHSGAEIHLEGAGNLTILNTDVTTDKFGFAVLNTDAGATRTITPTGFAGVFLRNGDAAGADLGNAAFSIADNAAYEFTVTLNAADRYLNITDRNLAQKQDTLVSGTNIKTVNSQSIVGAGNLVTAGAPMPTRAFNPVTDNMVNRAVHLRSDELTAAGALPTWTAAGGTAASGTQGTVANQPTVTLNNLNGKATAGFDTTDVLSIGTVATGSACTIIAVALTPVTPSVNMNTLVGANTGSTMCYGFNGNGLTNNKMMAVHAGTAWLGASTNVVAAGWHVLGYTWDASVDTLSYYTDGLANGTATYAGTPTVSPSVELGMRTGDGGHGFNSGIAEFMIFSVVLSATERAKAEGYLAWKYALQANLPAGHTYKNAAPSVVDIPIYANNAAAIAGGLTLGSLYRTGADPDILAVVH